MVSVAPAGGGDRKQHRRRLPAVRQVVQLLLFGVRSLDARHAPPRPPAAADGACAGGRRSGAHRARADRQGRCQSNGGSSTCSATGDFLGMSLTTDNVRPSAAPNGWQIGNSTIAGVIMGIGELLFCTAILVFGVYRMGLTVAALSSCSATKRRPIPIVSVVICGHPVPVSGSSSHPPPISSLPRP